MRAISRRLCLCPLGPLAEFDQRAPTLTRSPFAPNVARSFAPRDGTSTRLVSLHRHQRLIANDVVSFVDEPSHDFGFFETFAEIW